MARISKKVQEVNGIIKPDDLAAFVANKYTTWRGDCSKWLDESKELRNFVFQTSTADTSVGNLPWKNSTSVPKLAQLRDNLHANYYAALFPHDNWFKWEAAERNAADRETARIIEAYMKQKIRESSFKQAVSRAIYDYIDYGNAFGEVTYEQDVHLDGQGQSHLVYSGPKLQRISPYDIYFDLTADDFKAAGKITRRVVSMGSLVQAHAQDPLSYPWVPGALADARETRKTLNAYGESDIDKSEGFQIDGFGNLSSYYSGDMIELLEYEGDLYDREKDEILAGHRLIVMDRRRVVHSEPYESWLGKSNKEHVGWRPRPDNLMGMGPLDNLVGMQYRLDHLENLKADVFDQIAHPMVVVYGMVEDFEWEPGGRIYADQDARVDIVRPDATALNADFQITQLMENMEELAGAPKQAMGIRTPGEKTAFEIQALENAAGRIFQQKIQKFEEEFVEPLLNQMLEVARRNIGPLEQVKVLNDDFAIQEFLTIKPETLQQRGKLYPVGARHFAAQAQIVQNLLGFINSAAYQDPAVSAHISGKKIAGIMEEHLGLERFELVQDNIRIAENQETQSLATSAGEQVVGEMADRQAAEDLDFAGQEPEV
jgi:hypothetical protein